MTVGFAPSSVAFAAGAAPAAIKLATKKLRIGTISFTDNLLCQNCAKEVTLNEPHRKSLKNSD
jgi:hypothetical protein